MTSSHSFIDTRSTIIVSKEKLEFLIQKHSGKGISIGKAEVGMAGYKERIDFGEVIGTF